MQLFEVKSDAGHTKYINPMHVIYVAADSNGSTSIVTDCVDPDGIRVILTAAESVEMVRQRFSNAMKG